MNRPIIIGAGLAGLTAALALAPQPVVLISGRMLGEGTSSAWAQGGIAAALSDTDNTAAHADDTLRAGRDLNKADIVADVTTHAPAAIHWLEQQGVVFDRMRGAYDLGLEGGHSAHRIAHAGGDATGRNCLDALIAAVHATPGIEVFQETRVLRLVVDNNTVRGVVLLRGDELSFIPATQVVLATGGAGALWQHTTNPLGSWGHGIALAARAGAELADLEFMQFHPTAIDGWQDPMPLATEALRGAGAVLVDETGERFMASFPLKELEPRDTVARAIWQHREAGHGTFLDIRPVKDFAQKFPVVAALCAAAKIDPMRRPIPVAPAAHYHMGGVAVDAHGRSSVSGLYAIGEVACTGLHGANRLASNSLLEAVHFGRRVAETIQGHRMPLRPTGVPDLDQVPVRHLLSHSSLQDIRHLMSQHVGLVRHGADLQKAQQKLGQLSARSDFALVALMIATAALRRTESRGSHNRADYPATLAVPMHLPSLSIADIADCVADHATQHQRIIL